MGIHVHRFSTNKSITVNYSIVFSSTASDASDLLVQVPPKQLPEGHVVLSALLVEPSHTPVAGLHVPGVRQGPALAVQLTLVAVHKSAGCTTQSKKVNASA
jgi:hypothetical protein